MKKFSITTLIAMFAVCLTAILTLFCVNGSLYTQSSTLAANKALNNSGLKNVTPGAPSNLFTENKSGTISFLEIKIPSGNADATIKQFISTEHIVSEDEKGSQISDTLVLGEGKFYFTRSAHYVVTIGTNVYKCDFSPVFVTSNLSFLTKSSEGKFYALKTTTSPLHSYNTDLFTTTFSTENILPDSYEQSEIEFASNYTGEVFILPFTVITADISLEFYDKDENPITTSWIDDSESSGKYNIFNQSVRVKVVVSNSSFTEIEKTEILSHFTFNVNGGSETDFKVLDSQNFLFNESLSTTFYITKEFENENAQRIGGDENYIKIATQLPKNSNLSITFKEAPGGYDYIKKYFSKDDSSAIINSQNSTLYVVGPRELDFRIKNTSPPSTNIENVKNVGNYWYYTYKTSSNERFAFKFEVNYQNLSTYSSFSSFITLSSEPSYPETNYMVYGSYNFNVNTVGFDSILKLRLTFNGIVYEYTFEENTNKTITLNKAGNYIIEFYGMNDYETLKDSWLDANGENRSFDTYYMPLKNFNNGANAQNILKRSFRIAGAYTTAQTADGKYLFDNEFTNSTSILVNIYKDQDITYQVFKNNDFFSSNIENITTSGATFKDPGRWTISVYNVTTKTYSSLSFTIVNSSYQHFSFYSNPETNEDMIVKNTTKNSDLSPPVNHIYHVGEEGKYVATSIYNSLFTLKFLDGENVDLKSATQSKFEFEIKPSSFNIKLKTGKNGDRITENVVIESVTSNISATKMEVYLDGKLVKTYNANYVYYFSQVSASDRTFSSNGTYTIIVYDEYNNSYQLQVTKYFKMKTATVVLLVLAGLALSFGGVFAFRVRRKVKVK